MLHLCRARLLPLSRSFTTVLATTFVLSACAAPASSALQTASTASSVTSPVTYYTSKTPYQPQADYRHYSQAPEGYRLISVQHVARHGSRGLSSPGVDDLALQLWLQAQREQALTPLGLELGAAIINILQIHHDLGYGQLSGLGEQEHQAMAARLIARHQNALANLGPAQQFGMMHSGRSRARDSGTAFRQGWLQQRPTDTNRFLPDHTNEQVVYFHSAEGSEGYDAYRKGPKVAAVMAGYLADERTSQASLDILSALFTPAFIERLRSGQYVFSAHNDPEDQITNAEEAAMAIYDLFSIAVNLSVEDAADFTRFIPADTREWLAFIDDADSFYGRGPGFANEDISYAAASNLVHDMYQRALAVAKGNSTEFAMFRFTHAQALMPVATWLGLPNATQAAEAHEPYSYSNNPWRAAIIAPMSANIQWDVYQNAAGSTLVRMLWNEQETAFAEHCQAYSGYFYQLEALAECYALSPAASY